MKYLKNSFIYRIAVYTIYLYSAGATAFQLEAEHTTITSKHPELNIKISLNNFDYYLLEGKTKTPLNEDAVIWIRGDEIVFMDANQDGISDIFLKMIDGRSDSFYALHFVTTHNQNITLTEHPYTLGSPYLDENGHLISITHNGPYSDIDKYKTINGFFFKYETRKPLNPDIEKVTLLDENGNTVETVFKFLGSNDNASGCINIDNAYLTPNPSSAPQPHEKIAKGERVSLIQLESKDEWFEVEHHESARTGCLNS